jgi:3-dehydroquinate synthase
MGKKLDSVNYLYDTFLELGLDRSSLVVGIGGGALCDAVGFAASTYLRGIDFGFVPTTLLAQTDASIGGKNAINVKGFKNIVGTITQPRFVLCDLELLRTLPEDEIRSGFAEIIKHAAIGDARLFDLLVRQKDKALSLDKDILEDVLYRSISVKVKIVAKDETEQNERRKLNFGHTFGHAIESTCGLTHGQSVAIGMSVAAKISTMRKTLSKKEERKLISLIEMYGLPTRIDFDLDQVFDAMRKDKKRYGDDIKLVLLKRIGMAKVVDIKIDQLEKVVRKIQHNQNQAVDR